jgi:alkyl hydroperoxide reductase subunit F
MYDLIIVGGGPAGLTAAIYAIRRRLNVLLISKDLGGKTNFHLDMPGMENYLVINGVEVVDAFRSELEYLNFARRMEAVENITQEDDHFLVKIKEGDALKARTVIVATGARQQLMDVPGEREYLSRGLCYSAVSYAPLFIDKRAVVIGNGELAIRSTAELATVAEQVHLVGPTGSILNTPIGKKIKRAPNVTIMEGYKVTRVLGNGYAERIVIEDPDGVESDIPADGTFVEMALMPNNKMVSNLAELDDEGFIKVDCYNRTSIDGLFAAGDVTNIFAEQVLVAVGEGVKAALSAYEFLLPTL